MEIHYAGLTARLEARVLANPGLRTLCNGTTVARPMNAGVGHLSMGLSMAAYNPKHARGLYKLIIIIFAGAGFLLPLQLWGTLGLAKEPTPFKSLAFSVHIEVIVACSFAAVAFLATLALLTKSRLAPLICIAYLGLQMAYTVVETVLTYSTKQYFPGPKWGSILQATTMIIAFVVLSWFLATRLPRILKDA